MNNIFYCPKCKTLDTDFQFNTQKQRKEITTSNSRGGYGRPITHIYCPSCKYELSGFMFVRGLLCDETHGDKDLIEYVKEVIKGYSDGTFWDTEEVLKLIREDKRREKGEYE